jgi:hypothetical protein
MLKKTGTNNHYTTCNTQVPLARRFFGGNFTCTCRKLEIEEKAKVARIAQNSIPAGGYGRINTNYGTVSYQTNANQYYSSAIPFSSTVNGKPFNPFSEQKDEEPKVRYKKLDSYEDIIEDVLLVLNEDIFYANSSNLDIGLIFLDRLDYRIAQVKHKKKLEEPMPKTTLVQLGMEVDLRNLSSNSFVVKPLKGAYGLAGNSLRKDSFWVLSERDPGKPPFYLFEFPVNQFIYPKTDIVMLIDPYTCDQDYLTEEIFHAYGIKLMKKFDIKDARKLLETRRKAFEAAPTATNVILLFQLMDAIILNDFKTGTLDLNKTGEKNLVRLEKLKSLALDTKFNEERKNAVDKCFLQYNILTSYLDQEKVG